MTHPNMDTEHKSAKSFQSSMMYIILLLWCTICKKYKIIMAECNTTGGLYVQWSLAVDIVTVVDNGLHHANC